ncbi:2246_t:CDS:2 [Rhizophagus irregularis]|nr:2246_t:CDS:2 [Rhizophagus irregularis]
MSTSEQYPGYDVGFNRFNIIVNPKCTKKLYFLYMIYNLKIIDKATDNGAADNRANMIAPNY